MSEFGQQLSVMPHLAQAQYLAPVQPLHPAHVSHLQKQGRLLPPSQQMFPHQVVKPQSPLALSQSLNPPPVQFTQNIQKSGLVQPEPMRGQHLDAGANQKSSILNPEPIKGQQLEIGAVVEKLNALAVQEKESLQQVFLAIFLETNKIFDNICI